MPLQIRRGLQAERQAMTVPLASGELLYVTDDQRLYIGNGTTLGGIQVTGYTDEDAQEAVAELLLGASPITAADNSRHTGITFTYDDNDNRIDATVDFSGLAVLEADAFKGSLFADDSGLLVDAVAGSINLDQTVKGDIVPNVSETWDLGSPSLKFKDLYLSGSSLYLGDAQITATGAVVNLPAGSTVGGIVISQETGSINSDINGSVFANDSTILVDAIDGKLSTSGITIETNQVYTTDGESLSLYSSAGTSQLQVKFPVVAASSTGGDLLTAAGDWKFIEILGSKGSLTSTTDLVSGDVFGTFRFAGVQRTTGTDMGAVIGAQVDPLGTVTSTHIPTKLFFANVPDNSSAVNTPLLTFDSFGRLAVNQQNAQATLDINGFAKLAILTAAPATPANGMVAIADGTSWNPTTAPGKQQMVVYLGGGWRQMAVEP
jgi:hypothetical protein